MGFIDKANATCPNCLKTFLSNSRTKQNITFWEPPQNYCFWTQSVSNIPWNAYNQTFEADATGQPDGKFIEIDDSIYISYEKYGRTVGKQTWFYPDFVRYFDGDNCTSSFGVKICPYCTVYNNGAIQEKPKGACSSNFGM